MDYDLRLHQIKQTGHLIKRLRERFGIKDGSQIIPYFYQAIKSGNAKVIKDQVLAKVYEIEYQINPKKNMKFWVVFDLMTKQITTVLDPKRHGVSSLKLDHNMFDSEK